MIFIVGLLVWTEENVSQEFSRCVNDWSADYGSDQSSKDGLIVAKLIGGHALCVIRSIDRHNGFFAALAAFIVAFFTYTLDRATNRLWEIEDRNFRTAQRAFVSLDTIDYELTTAAHSKKSPSKEFRRDTLPIPNFTSPALRLCLG
jgi:hypothetical protein